MNHGTITEQTMRAYEKHLQLEEKSTATIQKYIRDVNAFRSFIGGEEISKESVIRFKQYLLQSGYASRSVNSMLASLNSLFSFLGWHGCKVRMIRLQNQIYCPEEKELSRAEYARLCTAAKEARNYRLWMILQTICSTGIRVSELKYITVEAVKRGEAAVSCKAKTRRVFLVSELRKKLLRFAAEQKITTGLIFVTRTGKPISRTNIWREMKALCARAAVDPRKVFPHNLRHLFARVFYSMEKDLAKLADILGHSSIDTTRIYIVSTGLEHRRKLEQMRLLV